jgi:peptidoglycan/xylan/chitin deacetylase (PgdA/CDA1 family)
MFVSPEHLRFHVRLLQRAGYTFTTVEHAIQLLSNNPRQRLACISFDDGYEDNFAAGLPVLTALGVPASVYVITGDVGKRRVVWNESGEKHPADMLSWEQLGRLHEAGWEIGSHTHQHVHLSRYSSDAQRELIESSCETLQRELGIRPSTFAYPYGDFSPETPSLLTACGFKAGLTTQCGTNPLPLRNSLHLKRIPGKGFRLYHYLKGYVMLQRFLH